MKLREPKGPTVAGWTENPEAARIVIEELRKRDLYTEPNARVWDKGSVRAISSYVSPVGGPAAWLVTVSRYNRKPNDQIAYNVCDDFGLKKPREIPLKRPTQRAFMEFDNAANGFI